MLIENLNMSGICVTALALNQVWHLPSLFSLFLDSSIVRFQHSHDACTLSKLSAILFA